MACLLDNGNPRIGSDSDEDSETEEKELKQFAIEHKYVDPDFEFILDAVERGDVALLRGSYLVQLDDEQRRIERRQDLPGEAFWSADELREYARWPSCTRESLDPGSTCPNFWVQSIIPYVMIAVLSYQWQTDAHPDPNRATLGLVAQRLRKGLKCPGFLNGILFRGTSRKVYDPDSVALFWDFGSLFQKNKERDLEDRTEEEIEHFTCGLGTSNVLYGHALTFVLRAKQIPGVPDKVYEDSGWCTFESAVSIMGKYERYVFIKDISDDRKHKVAKYKELAIETPEEFAEVIATKRFYSKLDVSKLVKMYEDIYSVRGQNKSLDTSCKTAYGYLAQGWEALVRR